MHDPRREDDFTYWVTCPNGHRGPVVFEFCHCCANTPRGKCEECECEVEWDLPAEVSV